MFYAKRNIRECLTDGVKLFSNNLRSLFRLLWVVVLCCSVVSLSVIMLSVLQTEWTQNNPQFLFMINVAIILLSLVIECVFLTSVYTIVKLHASSYDLSRVKRSFFLRESGGLMKRTFSWYLIVGVLIVVMILFPTIYLKIVFGIFMLLALPVMPTLVLSGKTFLRAMRYAFRLGTKYWFKSLKLVVLLMITVGVLLAITVAPMALCTLLLTSAEESFLAGDIVSESIFVISHPYMVMAVMLLSAVVTLFMQVMFYFPIAYLYASMVVSYEKEIADSGESQD